jgi:hypothetical protein
MAGFSASAIQSSPPAMSAASHIAPALPTGIPAQDCSSFAIHSIEFEGLQACLDAYNQSTFRSACVTKQEELFAKLNMLDQGANSVDNFREIFLGVRSFLHTMGSFSHLTEELAAHARWWVDFVIQLRQESSSISGQVLRIMGLFCLLGGISRRCLTSSSSIE